MRFYGDSLGSPKILLDNIPGARNHNGSRLAVGPDRYLYITTGDAQNSSLAQNRSSLAGKVLRLTLDGHPAPGNPFDNAVYSFGHRNAQGIVFHPGTGALYITEHGPADNDEVNFIIRSWCSPAVPVARGKVNLSLGTYQYIPEATKLALKVDFLLNDPAAIWGKNQSIKSGTLERRDK